jgi:hypothetical protein
MTKHWLFFTVGHYPNLPRMFDNNFARINLQWLHVQQTHQAALFFSIATLEVA